MIPLTDACAAQAKPNVACSHCNLRELCLPVGIPDDELQRLDGMVATRRSVRRGHTLFRHGDPFEAVYAVRTGFFKTRITPEDGRDQVTGFQMAGELLGLDGIGNDHHACDAVALEDSQVCVIPYSQLTQLSREFPGLQRQFHKIMSREIVRDHGVMLLLGSMRAEERLAVFLLNLSQRLKARGFSPSSLVLRMTREEIGTYLGLKLETVSRCFSKFQEDGVLAVRQRQIDVLDPEALQRLVNNAHG
ncbi:fumarate/nitrate reduction transcriptional regulator Fnr [Ideonella azotifigens]|uniref:Fumarate/nitrate reduction transcriptional regulator Fnr n=1 Tax=Ideonella azotifigens TaxID=513160 RepID=A0ABP3V281_9BURK|nr:fumarate/nitrate reduction transcriptional regulator Fnr [Ideonella azotifigens]MCD2341147.1 fumarate/nitrate reduction transcriptional regulator Fnr [Ideonella azotifigens]